MSESIEWVFEIYLFKVLDETAILSQLFSPYDGNVQPATQIYFSPAKVQEIPPSIECWGADRSHQLSYGVAVTLTYKISPI